MNQPHEPAAVDPSTPAPPALDAQPIGAMAVGPLLERIASKTPAPGGGAVVGLVGALAASLGQMVLAYSQGRSAQPEHERALGDLAEAWTDAACRLLALADADAAAYARLNALQRLPEADPGRSQLPEAARRCMAVPMDVQREALVLLEQFLVLRPMANRWLLSDLRIAAILAEAVVRASACTVQANAPVLRRAVDDAAAAQASQASERACRQAQELLTRLLVGPDARG